MRNRTTDAIRDYLGKVESRLSKMSKEERQAILDDLESHISEALINRSGDAEPTPDDVEAILSEMDSPEAFGTVEPATVPPPAPRHIMGKIALCLSILGALFTVMYMHIYLGSPTLFYFHEVFGGVAVQAIALTLGIFAWRSIFGKLAVTLSLILLLSVAYAKVYGIMGG